MTEGTAARVQRVFEQQWIHAIGLVVLLSGLLVVGRQEAVRQGAVLGVTTWTWLWIAAWAAIAHQVYVWFCWRMELHGGTITRLLGQRAFAVYAIGFSVLGVLRVGTAWVVAAANGGTLAADPFLTRSLALAALLPAVYLFYSVHRYFGFQRAFGIDHFDSSYRTMPLVRRGIFRWSPNAMYMFGFLLFWALALWYGSVAALAIALFNHLYIWVHYVGTERPDMRRIYGPKIQPEV